MARVTEEIRVLRDEVRQNSFLGMKVWVLHRITGLGLALYLIPHITIIGSARISRGMFNLVSSQVQVAPHHPATLYEWVKQVGVPALDILILAAILFHGLNGIRLIIADFGGMARSHRALFYAAMVVGAVLLVVGAGAILRHLH